jgi:sec-independent protein translocase protein TatC
MKDRHLALVDDEEDEYEGEEMEFLDHLEELRVRLLRMIVYVVVAAIVCIAIAGGTIVPLATEPIRKALPETGGQMLITKPFEAMVTWLKIDALAGVLIAMPFVGYEVWGFIAPALSRRERKLASTIVLACPALFISGALFIYFVFPMALRFLISFAEFFPDTQVMLNPKETIGMMLTLMLGMGLVFQMPIVIGALAKFGVVTSRGLLGVWRHAIVVIMIVAAFLTPTWDPVNLGIVAGPMVLLYFSSIGIAGLIERAEARREARRKAARAQEMELVEEDHDEIPEEGDDGDEADDDLALPDGTQEWEPGEYEHQPLVEPVEYHPPTDETSDPPKSVQGDDSDGGAEGEAAAEPDEDPPADPYDTD